MSACHCSPSSSANATAPFDISPQQGWRLLLVYSLIRCLLSASAPPPVQLVGLSASLTALSDVLRVELDAEVDAGGPETDEEAAQEDHTQGSHCCLSSMSQLPGIMEPSLSHRRHALKFAASLLGQLFQYPDLHDHAGHCLIVCPAWLEGHRMLTDCNCTRAWLECCNSLCADPSTTMLSWRMTGRPYLRYIMHERH